MVSRLVLRLSGRSGGIREDLDRLLGMRSDDAPARPDLGLPPLPPWLPDHAVRRGLQEAIARTVRDGEPRLAGVRVSIGGDGDDALYRISARLHDGSAMGAEARLARGRPRMAP